MGDLAVRRIVGVYDADGTVRGELSYFVGVRLGRAHCSLCDITHGAVRERAEWRDWRSRLPVPFETFHRNDQPDAVRDLLAGAYPAVAAETADGWVLLLGPQQLDACEGSPERLVSAVEGAAAALALCLGPVPG